MLEEWVIHNVTESINTSSQKTAIEIIKHKCSPFCPIERVFKKQQKSK